LFNPEVSFFSLEELFIYDNVVLKSPVIIMLGFFCFYVYVTIQPSLNIEDALTERLQVIKLPINDLDTQIPMQKYNKLKKKPHNMTSIHKLRILFPQ
jgi:hypothetical protein